MNTPLILGIDPGLSGAMALLNAITTDLAGVYNFSDTNKQRGAAKELDIYDVAKWLSEYKTNNAAEIKLAIVEDVHSMPKDGPRQAFLFGKSNGIILGILGSMQIPIVFANPSVWKASFGLDHDKNKSLMKATKIFGEDAKHLYWPILKYNGAAEAALLAYFGLRFVK